jgi:hypothetical protein
VSWTDYAQAIGSIATALALVVAIVSAWIALKAARRTAEQSEAYAGAQAAIAWREQVFQMHDRGLTPGQIRYIMHLEGGGTGYELGNGRIDDVVRGVPAREPRIAGNDEPVPSCDVMPGTMDGCPGPCTRSLAVDLRRRKQERA